MGKSPKRWFQASLGILFAGLFLYLALRKMEPARLWFVLWAVDLRFFVPILLSLAVYFWLKAIRWSLLLTPLRPGRPLTLREVFPALMIGFMANNILPAHLGEFVRMFVLSRQYGLSKASVLSTIVLERVLDFLVILGTFAVTVKFIPMSGDLEMVRSAGVGLGLVCLFVFVLFLAFVWQTDRSLQATGRVLSVFPLPHALRAKLMAMVSLGVEGLGSLRKPRVLVIILGITLVHWSMLGLGLYLSTVSFIPDHWPSSFASFVLLGVTALGITLPSAPGYVGTLQFCFVLALSGFGVQRETALAASFYWLFWSYVPVTLVGFYFLARLGLNLGTLRQEASRGGVESATPTGQEK